MIGAQPMLRYTVLYTYILCHICNVTLVYKKPLWCSGKDQEVLGSNHVKSKIILLKCISKVV